MESVNDLPGRYFYTVEHVDAVNCAVLGLTFEDQPESLFGRTKWPFGNPCAGVTSKRRQIQNATRRLQHLRSRQLAFRIQET